MVKSRLKEVLEEEGVSALAFARLLKRSERQVFRYLEDSYDPKLSTLATWADALGIDVHRLIGRRV